VHGRHHLQAGALAAADEQRVVVEGFEVALDAASVSPRPTARRA
jgi:hypothetical protein